MKKIRISKEATYVIAILLLSFSVAMITCTDFGVSMIVAPAYILSQKVAFLSFGSAEYVVQAVLFVIFCIAMKRVKPIYFCSFLTGVIYGAVLDLWRKVIPHFNPEINQPGSLPTQIKVIYFILGMLLTSLSIALFYKTYFYPQVYDFYVKGVSGRYGISTTKFKIGFDFSFLIIACILSVALFKKLVGVGFGTIIMTCLNGVVIGFFSSFLDKHVDFYARSKRIEKIFEI